MKRRHLTLVHSKPAAPKESAVGAQAFMIAVMIALWLTLYLVREAIR